MTQHTLFRRVHGHRPHLLDAFCCQDGAAKDYADAGFEFIGRAYLAAAGTLGAAA